MVPVFFLSRHPRFCYVQAFFPPATDVYAYGINSSKIPYLASCENRVKITRCISIRKFAEISEFCNTLTVSEKWFFWFSYHRNRWTRGIVSYYHRYWMTLSSLTSWVLNKYLYLRHSNCLMEKDANNAPFSTNLLPSHPYRLLSPTVKTHFFRWCFFAPICPFSCSMKWYLYFVI